MTNLYGILYGRNSLLRPLLAKAGHSGLIKSMTYVAHAGPHRPENRFESCRVRHFFTYKSISYVFFADFVRQFVRQQGPECLVTNRP